MNASDFQTSLEELPVHCPPTVFFSDEMARILVDRFESLEGFRGEHSESFFKEITKSIRRHFGDGTYLAVKAWEDTLQVLQRANAARHEALHKGTPFYFLGVNSFAIEDFERALFYMDCALAQDRKVTTGWNNLPAWQFLLLDETSRQFGGELISDTVELFEYWGNEVAKKARGGRLTLDTYRNRLVARAVKDEPLRSAVTGFLSFLLETKPRQMQLRLGNQDGVTGEPFFLHLLKGGLLLETLLKCSPAGKKIVAAREKNKDHTSIGDLLCDPTIFKRLGFKKKPQGVGDKTKTFTDLLVNSFDAKFHRWAFRATWGLRNLTGHTLALSSRPTDTEYQELLVLTYACLSLVLKKLYPRPRKPI